VRLHKRISARRLAITIPLMGAEHDHSQVVTMGGPTSMLSMRQTLSACGC